MIKLDSSFTKTGDMATKLSYKGLVGEIDGVPVIKVPSSYMPTNCEFIITHPMAAISPSKLTYKELVKEQSLFLIKYLYFF